MSIWAIVMMVIDNDYLNPFFQDKAYLDWLIKVQSPYAVYPLVSFVILATGLFLIPVNILLSA